MKKVELEKLEKINGGVNGFGCFAYGLGLVFGGPTSVVDSIRGRSTLKDCWNS